MVFDIFRDTLVVEILQFMPVWHNILIKKLQTMPPPSPLQTKYESKQNYDGGPLHPSITYFVRHYDFHR